MLRRSLAALVLLLLAGCGAPVDPKAATTATGGDVGGGNGTPPTISNPLGSSPAQLYIHPFADRSEPMALNTQLPNYGFVQDEPLPGPAVGCEPASGVSSVRWLAYSSPGYVRYNETEPGGKPRLHDEAQLGDHLRIDREQPLRLTWHLVAAREQAGQGPLVLPDVTVKARLRERTLATDQEGWNEGEVLAEGEASGTLAGPATTSRSGNVSWNGPADTDNGRWIYTFKVELAQPTEIFIPRGAGFTLEVEAAMPGDCAGGLILERALEAHFSPLHQASLALHAFRAVSIDLLHPMIVDDELVIHTAMRSVWGSYDVDEPSFEVQGTKGGIELTVDGPSRAINLRRGEMDDPDRSHERHNQPRLITYYWPFGDEGAHSGRYTVTLNVRNDQMTAVASATATIHIPDSGRP